MSSSDSRMVVSKVARAVSSASATSAGPAASVRKAVNKIDTSGLTLLEVVLTLSVLLGLFLCLLLVGELCKIFNKPKAEATPYATSSNTPKLFQPSAAGYGTRVAELKAPEGNAAYSSRVSLLGGASPMGRGGSQDDSRDSPYGTPNSQHSNGRDYFGRAGHTRGQSSGIQLPGATASAARRGGPSHPPIQGSSIAPDGSGFQVGQTINQQKKGPTTPNGYGPRGYDTSPTASRGGQQHRATPSKVGLGPPPATDARRRSRYARNDSRRIDSIGPGAVRKSMFMTDEGNPAAEGGPRTNGNLRRIDSVGKGDHRRKSTYNFDKRGAGLSIYTNGEGNLDGYGSSDPLGAKPLVSPSAGARGNAMPPLQRQPSPSGLPAPTDMGKAPTIGKPLQQQVQPQNSQYSQQRPSQQAGVHAAQGYPGGGMPRMPADRAFSPMRSNFERGARQVV